MLNVFGFMGAQSCSDFCFCQAEVRPVPISALPLVPCFSETRNRQKTAVRVSQKQTPFQTCGKLTPRTKINCEDELSAIVPLWQSYPETGTMTCATKAQMLWPGWSQMLKFISFFAFFTVCAVGIVEAKKDS